MCDFLFPCAQGECRYLKISFYVIGFLKPRFYDNLRIFYTSNNITGVRFYITTTSEIYVGTNRPNIEKLRCLNYSNLLGCFQRF